MTVSEDQTTWFLAQLKPNCAQIADRNLKRQGFETFLPMEETTRPSKGRLVTSQQALFPGYIFVALDAQSGPWRRVNSTYGITRLVSFGTTPAGVPTPLVTALRRACDASGRLLPSNQLKPGDRVKHRSGPFANFVSEIEAIAPDQRVWVLMDIMGGKTRVAVDAAQLRAV